MSASAASRSRTARKPRRPRIWKGLHASNVIQAAMPIHGSGQHDRVVRSTINKHVIYDQKYHPMDQFTRPNSTIARKHRIDDSGNGTDSDELHSANNNKNSGMEDNHSGSISRPHTGSIRRSSPFTTSRDRMYDMAYHPAGRDLDSSASEPQPKRRLLSTSRSMNETDSDGDDTVEHSRTARHRTYQSWVPANLSYESDDKGANSPRCCRQSQNEQGFRTPSYSEEAEEIVQDEWSLPVTTDTNSTSLIATFASSNMEDEQAQKSVGSSSSSYARSPTCDKLGTCSELNTKSCSSVLTLTRQNESHNVENIFSGLKDISSRVFNKFRSEVCTATTAGRQQRAKSTEAFSFSLSFPPSRSKRQRRLHYLRGTQTEFTIYEDGHNVGPPVHMPRTLAPRVTDEKENVIEHVHVENRRTEDWA